MCSQRHHRCCVTELVFVEFRTSLRIPRGLSSCRSFVLALVLSDARVEPLQAFPSGW
jgi:hypothetical protein